MESDGGMGDALRDDLRQQWPAESAYAAEAAAERGALEREATASEVRRFRSAHLSAGKGEGDDEKEEKESAGGSPQNIDRLVDSNPRNALVLSVQLEDAQQEPLGGHKQHQHTQEAQAQACSSDDDTLMQEAKQLWCAGNRKKEQGDTAGALQLYERVLACSLRIMDKQKARQVQGVGLSNIGEACSRLGQNERAIKYLIQALAISREVGDVRGEVFRLSSLGNTYRNLGQYESAVTHLEKALSLHVETGDRRGEANRLRDLADVYGSLGKFERSADHLSQAMAIRCELGDQRGKGHDLSSLGATFLRMGQYERAVELMMQALVISCEFGDRRSEGSDLGNLGVAYCSLGDYECAITHLEQSLSISREIGNRQGEGGALGDLGTAYCNLGQHERAIEYHARALACHCEVGDSLGEGRAMGSLGTAHCRLGQYERGLDHLTQALAISRENGDRQGEASSLGSLGCTHLDHLEQPAVALPLLQQACAAYDYMWARLHTDERLISYGDTYAAVARNLQRAYARLDQPAAALEEAERTRSRSFEVLLAKQRIAGGMAAAAPSSAAAPLRCDALHAVAERQRVTIVIFSQVTTSQLLVWTVRGGGVPLSMKTIDVPRAEQSFVRLVELTRRTIGARACQGEATPLPAMAQSDRSALAPQMMDEATALTDRPIRRRDLATEVMEEVVEEDEVEGSGADGGGSGSTTVAQEPIAIDDLLRRCHELLIAPLELACGEPLLLIPDSDLYALPFAALLSADGKHLIERHSLRVAPSVGTVIELEVRAACRGAAAAPAALVVGNPVYHGWAKQLPAAEAEARRVSETLATSAGFKVCTLTDVDATKPAVVEAMRGCDVIHLATHGEPGSVLLGGATRAEGALSMAEVQGLELSARLVVLSECDSFRGKLTGDGVIGITRAFVVAGALTLVASLWKVEDAATRTLMASFYARLLAGGSVGDTAAALQSAMVSMISEHRWTVQQWASFVVYGL